MNNNITVRSITFVDFINYKGYSYGDVVVGQNVTLDTKYTGDLVITLRFRDMKTGNGERYRFCVGRDELGKQTSYTGLVYEVMLAIQNMGYKLYGEDKIKQISEDYEEIANRILDDILEIYEPIYRDNHKLYLGDRMFDVLDNFYNLK